ncbi:DNA replication licensing factor Mcm3 [Aricia agestis]|uniref:DNA replication licensing factor Mcm3 n=1 Tax=Aricia agestis TaxID=91739 RepID=UPI001C20791E|nr:DNA replication licensing factor Mcm3 [Aricia agestis]XP_041968024.1 DNA replication licensing factor Mcm3 [Aricia agestis]
MDEGDFDQRLRDLQREYLEFLDDEEEQGVYSERVKQMISENSKRLVVNINDLRRKSPNRAKNLLENAFEEQIAFQKALKEYVSSIDPTYAKEQEEFFVAFSGSFGSKHVTPRSLTSRYLGNLICVEGIVTRVSLVRPKVVRSVHYCPATKKVMERKYTDLTSFEAFPTSAVYPTKDDEGNPLETEYGLSRYKDHQTLTVQEMPEKAPAGQLPRSVDIICDDDLVDKCKPGDRVQVVGNYRCLPSKQGSFTAGTFRTILIANNVTQINKDMNLSVTREDIKLCKRLANRSNSDIFDVLSKSLAPSIHGHDYIKKAILCLLLGGMEKILPNGTRLRGDINILLIGDPSVAKSQLLRYVLMTAPRAITTTGRGSSGVGLTAAVTTDPETGDRRLEAGAMVLADRGVVCIDEFDKMSDIDRTAIHEVMEQGRVTIAKAGVHAALNARCSVLAAANPVYGRYDQYKTPMENIGLQDSLLSRFDLLFVMLDIADADHDNMISEHVLRMHRYRNPKEQDGEVLPMGSTVEMLSTENPDNEEQETNESIYEKYDPLLHGNTRSKKDQILSTSFMRKFINIAKFMKPKLTQEASDTIADEYTRLRNQDTMDSDVAKTQPVTARTLETLIRLSTAHAKCRLSFQVTRDDALAAIELVHFAYFKKVLIKEKRRKRRASSGEEDGSDKEEEQPRAKRTRRTRDASQAQDPYDFSSDEETEPVLRAARASQPPPEATPTTSKSIQPQRLSQFKSALQQLYRDERANNLPLDRVTSHINQLYSHEPFDAGEIHAALNRMTQDNQVMMADDIIFLV